MLSITLALVMGIGLAAIGKPELGALVIMFVTTIAFGLKKRAMMR